MEKTDVLDGVAVDPTPPSPAGRVTPERRAFAIREVVDRLISAVDVDNDDVNEYNVLGDLLVRSGLAWRCIQPQCDCINHLDNLTCDNCDSRKPRKRETPQPSWD